MNKLFNIDRNLPKSTVTVAGRATRNFDRNLPLTEREVTIETDRDAKRKIRLPQPMHVFINLRSKLICFLVKPQKIASTI